MTKKEWLLDIIAGKIAKLGDEEWARLENLSEVGGEGRAYSKYIGDDWLDQAEAVVQSMLDGTYIRPS